MKLLQYTSTNLRKIEIIKRGSCGDAWKLLVKETAQATQEHKFDWLDRVYECKFSSNLYFSVIASCCLVERHAACFLKLYSEFLKNAENLGKAYLCHKCRNPINCIFFMKRTVHNIYSLERHCREMIFTLQQFHNLPKTYYSLFRELKTNFDDEIDDIFATEKAALKAYKE